MHCVCVSSQHFKIAKVAAGHWKPVWSSKKLAWTVCYWYSFWRCGGSVIWRLLACITANAIVLIAQIGVTRASFASDASGSWICSVEPAIKPTLFTAYPFVSWRLDGASHCVFNICQGESTCPRKVFDERLPHL